jgi:putative NIF3 family GTP cyclohydrolase 1 type 2
MGAEWGWYGNLGKSQTLNKIVNKCEKIFQQKPIVYSFGKDKIKSIAAISGGGSPYGKDLQNLLERNIDLYITGEVTEGIRELTREAEVNLIAGGHYATERLGVLALMDEVRKKFKNKVSVEFIELWNKI